MELERWEETETTSTATLSDGTILSSSATRTVVLHRCESCGAEFTRKGIFGALADWIKDGRCDECVPNERRE